MKWECPLIKNVKTVQSVKMFVKVFAAVLLACQNGNALTPVPTFAKCCPANFSFNLGWQNEIP